MTRRVTSNYHIAEIRSYTFYPCSRGPYVQKVSERLEILFSRICSITILFIGSKQKCLSKSGSLKELHRINYWMSSIKGVNVTIKLLKNDGRCYEISAENLYNMAQKRVYNLRWLFAISSSVPLYGISGACLHVIISCLGDQWPVNKSGGWNLCENPSVFICVKCLQSLFSLLHSRKWLCSIFIQIYIWIYVLIKYKSDQ